MHIQHCTIWAWLTATQFLGDALISAEATAAAKFHQHVQRQLLIIIKEAEVTAHHQPMCRTKLKGNQVTASPQRMRVHALNTCSNGS